MSAILKCCPKSPKTTFSATSQLNDNFNGLYLRMKHDIHNRASTLETTTGLLQATSSQNVMNLDRQTASNWRWVFTHTPQILHSALLPGFANGDQQTELNHILPNVGQQIAQIMCRENRDQPFTKLGPKNFYICSVFRRLRYLMANIFWMKHDTDNRARSLERRRGPLYCPQIS